MPLRVDAHQGKLVLRIQIPFLPDRFRKTYEFQLKAEVHVEPDPTTVEQVFPTQVRAPQMCPPTPNLPCPPTPVTLTVPEASLSMQPPELPPPAKRQKTDGTTQTLQSMALHPRQLSTAPCANAMSGRRPSPFAAPKSSHVQLSGQPGERTAVMVDLEEDIAHTWRTRGAAASSSQSQSLDPAADPYFSIDGLGEDSPNMSAGGSQGMSDDSILNNLQRLGDEGLIPEGTQRLE